MKRVRRKTTKFGIKGAKIGSKLRIRLPKMTIDEYANKLAIPSMFNLTNYDPDKEQKLKQWCVEQALQVVKLDVDGNKIQPDIIKTAQKIYDWVTK